jgi:hypothetical protein
MQGWYHGGLSHAASTVLAALAVCACATRSPPSNDTAPRRAGGSAESDAKSRSSVPTRWDRIAEVRQWPPVNETPFVSLGHPPGNQSARVHASPEARDLYQGLLPETTLPVGAVVAELQQDPTTRQPGLAYVMTKLGRNRWEFMLVKADGRILERGDVPFCARCHAEAVADSLFGVPAEK